MKQRTTNAIGPPEAASNDPGSSDRYFSIVADSRMSGIRLDQFLSQHVPSASRSLVALSIRRGLITVDGVNRKTSYRLKAGETIEGFLGMSPEVDVHPQKIDFPILYEDSSLLIISKPPGLVVHPGSGNPEGTLVSGLLHHCRTIAEVGDRLRPGIVHRLDKDTSGIMVVAKTDEVHRCLVGLFKDRQLYKEYLALLHGCPHEKAGRIVAAIGRHPVQRQKMAVRNVGGRHAATRFEVLQEFAEGYSLVKIGLETGRTHQIRVHMAHLGCPVAGDTVYGSGRNNRPFVRQLLHASRLAFDHPVTGVHIDRSAPLWPDFYNFLASLGWRDAGERGR